MLSGVYKHTCTYWAPNALDGFGNRPFASPVALKVRWEDRTDIIIRSQDETRPSKAVVYLQQSVALGGYLALGDYATTPTADPTTLANAHMIQTYQESPVISGQNVTRKAVL